MRGFYPLASGSKGNCLYVGSSQTKILIDAGIPTSSIISRLEEKGIDPKTIDAILITHEHSDHIKGLSSFVEKFSVPIFVNAQTARRIYASLKKKLPSKIFTTEETFIFKDLQIHPFSIPHDTLDPVAFTIQIEKIKLGICADLGYPTSLVQNHLKNCDILYLEANHEPSLVHASKRPSSLKNRILGRQGHLSNAQCAELLSTVFHERLKRVYLAHLSEECNREELALETAKEKLKKEGKEVDLYIAYQNKGSEPILFE